jgi:hypothetical protein
MGGSSQGPSYDHVSVLGFITLMGLELPCANGGTGLLGCTQSQV